MSEHSSMSADTFDLFRDAQARTTLLLRARDAFLGHRDAGRYPDLADADANVVANGLTSVAVGDPAITPETGAEALVLARRLLDLDDAAPEDSPLWPGTDHGTDRPMSWRHRRPSPADAA